ncbi:MAG: ESX secretion-associated protein EspG, partial [Kutzneria sp.]|nr:ESX secretion-associated protein EspG [Kutzneria sp.]
MSLIATLSLAALDVLWEDLSLGTVPPYPFEVPSHGETYAERARIRAAVHTDLDQRGLLTQGLLAPRLVTALHLLARPQLQVDTVSALEIRGGSVVPSAMLHAMAAARGRNAVLAAQDGLLIRLTEISDTALAASLVGLLPANHAGPGAPVSLPAHLVGAPLPNADGSDEHDGAAVVTRRTASSASPEQRKALAAMLEPPKLRVGQIGIGRVDEHGTSRRLPGIGWFDTAGGRYFTS